MRLTALICNRYRAFKERQRIELAPITLIIGKNGSGKSVISRLPLLLSSAISEQAEGPLDLAAGGVEHAATFQDLVNSRGALPFTLGAEIADDHRSYTFETTLRYVNETRSLAIESFLLKAGDDALFNAEISDVEELTNDHPLFNTRVKGSEAQQTRLSFAGLFPVLIASKIRPVLNLQLCSLCLDKLCQRLPTLAPSALSRAQLCARQIKIFASLAPKASAHWKSSPTIDCVVAASYRARLASGSAAQWDSRSKSTSPAINRKFGSQTKRPDCRSASPTPVPVSLKAYPSSYNISPTAQDASNLQS